MSEVIAPEMLLGGKVSLFGGDNRDVLRSQPDASVDSIVTDPPYALVSIVKRFGKPGSAPGQDHHAGGAYARASRGFMGQNWDTGETAFAVEFWAECLRVLKPGGHVVAFSGTRTYHRMVCAIEDAGFEIRDQIGWLYGSGFPKSHDVAKAIDKAAGVEFESAPDAGVGFMGPDGPGGYNVTKHQLRRKGESTTAAKAWAGWGTALKPAWEPICLARKPLDGTVVSNVLAHGTGAINIDGCRIEAEKQTGWGGNAAGGNTWNEGNAGLCKDGAARPVEGRFPANVLHDGSAEVLETFPAAPGQQGALSGREPSPAFSGSVYVKMGRASSCEPRADAGGSAARFFYSAKADAHDRIGSKHPTVKPVDLMQWLVRLVTPKGGLVLDPFAGTGTTAEAAFREGMRCMLIEREAEYQSDIRRRMALALAGPEERARESIKAKVGEQPFEAGSLFAGLSQGESS